MNTLERLEAAQAKLTALYGRQRANLLPDEDRAFVSMLGKMALLADFLRLPPEKVALLPACGEGSWIEGEQLAAAMAADVEGFAESK